MLAHSVNSCSTHRFWIQSFTTSSAGCPFGFPYGEPSRTECLQNSVWCISCDQYFCWMEHFRLFSFHIPRNSWETCASFFSRSLTQPSNERLAFFQVDWTIRSPLFVQPLTLLSCKPEGLNELVLYSAKSLSPPPLLQSNLLSLTWYFKYTQRTTPDATFFHFLYKLSINLSYQQLFIIIYWYIIDNLCFKEYGY